MSSITKWAFPPAGHRRQSDEEDILTQKDGENFASSKITCFNTLVLKRPSATIPIKSSSPHRRFVPPKSVTAVRAHLSQNGGH